MYKGGFFRYLYTMNEQQITEAFSKHLEMRSALKTFGLTKDHVKNYRRKLPTFGTILGLMFNAGLITVTINEPTTGTE